MVKRPHSSQSASSTELSPKNPYPGPRSFGENDRTYFFGRDSEIVELFDRIKSRTLTVLHGKSGLGKTSLLQAGVFPKLRQHGFFPLRLLFQFEGAAGFAEQIRQDMRAEIDEGRLDAKPPGEGESLWSYFQHTTFWDATGEVVIPVLVLDQFEEALQPKQHEKLQALIVELADLVENWVPQALLANNAEQTSSRPERAPQVQVVLSLREDYLAELDELRPKMPSLAAPRMRLGPLRGKNAMQAVIDPAKNEKLLGDEEGVINAVAEKIVCVVAGQVEFSEAIEVESSLLALYCYELNRTRIEARLPAIVGDMVNPEERNKLLMGFYLRCMKEISLETRRLVEEKLLSGGRRDTMARDTLSEQQGAEIDKLVNEHLLRREKRLNRDYVEIVHDVLVKPIGECRNKRIAEETIAAEQAKLAKENTEKLEGEKRQRIEAEKQKEAAETRATLAEAQQKLQKEQQEKEIADEKHQHQRDRNVVLGLVGLTLLAVVGVWWWRSSTQKAEEAARADVEAKSRQAEQLGEQAGASLSEERWDEAARTLARALNMLITAQEAETAFRNKYGAPNGDAEFAKPVLLPLLTHRFVASMGDSRLLLQDREGVKKVVLSDQSQLGAGVLSDGRTIRFFDADDPQKPAWAADTLPQRDSQARGTRLGAGKVLPIDDFDDSVRDLKITGNGEYAFVAGDEGSIAVLQVKDGKRVFGFRTEIADPNLRVDRTGRIVLLHSARATSVDEGADVAVRLHLTTDKGVEDGSIDLKPPRASSDNARWAMLAPADDGEHVVGLLHEPDGTWCQWYVWSFQDGKPAAGERIENCTGRVARSASGKTLAIVLKSGEIKFWMQKNTLPEAGRTIQPESTSIKWLNFDPQKEDLLFLGSDKMVEVVSTDEKQRTLVVFPGEETKAAALMLGDKSNAHEILVRTNDDLVAFNRETAKAIRSWRLPLSSINIFSKRADLQRINNVILRPEKRQALVITGDAVRLLSLKNDFADKIDEQLLWGLASSGQAERTVELAGIGQPFMALAHGNRLALLSEKGLFFVDDLTAANLDVRRWRTSGGQILGFDWKTTTTDSSAGNVAAFDMKLGLEIGTPDGSNSRVRVPDDPLKNWEGLWRDIALSDDGKWAAFRLGTKVYVWKTETAKQVWEWKLPPPKTGTLSKTGSITAFAITTFRNTPRVVVGDEKGRVYVIDTAGEKPAALEVVDNRAPSRVAIGRIVLANNALFATGDQDGNVARFRIEEQPPLRVSLVTSISRKHNQSITDLRFLPDNKYLLSIDDEGKTRVSDDEGKIECEMSGHTRGVYDINLDPRPNSNRALTTDWGGDVVLWDTSTCAIERSFNGMTSAFFSPGSILTVSDARTKPTVLKFWKDASSENKEENPAGPSGVLVWGSVLNEKPITSDDRGHVFGWLNGQPKPIAKSAHEKVASKASLVATAKTRTVALTKEGLWLDWRDKADEPKTGQLSPAPEGILRAASLSRDGARLLLVEETKKPPFLQFHILKDSAGEGFTKDKTEPTPIDAGTACGTAIATPNEKERAIFATAIDNDNAMRVVAIEPDGCTRIWNEEGKLLFEGPSNMGSTANLVVLSPKGDRLAVADKNNAVSFLELKLDKDAQKSALVRISWDPDRHQDQIRAITFHPSNRFAVTVGDDAQAWLWDAEAGKALIRIGTHPSAIRWAAFNTKGDRLFTGGAEAWLRSWDTRTTLQTGKDTDDLLNAIYNWLPELKPQASATRQGR